MVGTEVGAGTEVGVVVVIVAVVGTAPNPRAAVCSADVWPQDSRRMFPGIGGII